MMYETIETWLTLITDSTSTRVSYSYHTSKFFEMFELDPDKLVEEWNVLKYSMRNGLKERFLDEIRGYLDKLKVKCKKKGYAEKTIATKIASICSFFNHYRIKLDYGIKSGQVTYHNRSIKKEEIKDILEHCSLRERVFFKIMQESGLRPHTLVRLRYKHIKDDYEKGTPPMCIDTPANIVKGKSVTGRFTFIGSEAFELLKQYLKPREPVEYEDLIFQPKKPNRMTGDLLPTQTFSNIFRKIVRKLGISRARDGKPTEIRQYCLRKYFRNNAKCDPYYIQFWLHHKLGSSDIHYISRDVDRHREEYTKAYPHLKIYDNIDSKELDKIQHRNQILSDMVVDLNKEVKELSYRTLNRREQLKEYLLSDEGREVLKDLFRETIPVELYPMIRDRQ